MNERGKSENFADSLFVRQFIMNLFIDASNLHSAAVPGECILSREAISCISVRTMRDHLTKLEITAAISGNEFPAFGII